MSAGEGAQRIAERGRLRLEGRIGNPLSRLSPPLLSFALALGVELRACRRRRDLRRSGNSTSCLHRTGSFAVSKACMATRGDATEVGTLVGPD
jgi:hypothetical protein